MSDFDDQRAYDNSAGSVDMALDAGLRGFMLGVYNKMMLGLALAGGIAWTVGNIRPVSELLFNFVGSRPTGYTLLGMIVAFAPLALILFSNFFMRRTTPAMSAVLYWAIVSLVGASLGVLFLVYTGAQISTAFLITAGAFGALSLFGYVTKMNLTGVGSFLIMGAWGIVAASVVSFFMPGLAANPMFFWIINVASVLIFGGLIAFKTQDLKMTYYQLQGDTSSLAVATNYGALFLFISFINLFQSILALLGGSRR